MAEQVTASHLELLMCVVDQLGWAGWLVGGVMFAGLIGPPGMIYRAMQRRKRQS